MLANKTIIRLLFLFLLFSCNSNILIDEFDLKKEQVFYLGLNEVTIFKINNTNNEILKIVNNKEYILKGKDSVSYYKWQKIKKSSKIILNLIKEIKTASGSTKSIESIDWANSFVDSFTTNQDRYLISGLIGTMKDNELEIIKNLYYCNILDLKGKKLFVIEFNH